MIKKCAVIMTAKVGRPKLSGSWFCFGAVLLQLKWCHAALLGTVAVREHYELTVSLDTDAHSQSAAVWLQKANTGS